MIYIYGHDFIKYLNDDSSGLLTYDQWKSKNSHQAADSCISCGNAKAPKYTKGHYSLSAHNKNLC